MRNRRLRNWRGGHNYLQLHKLSDRRTREWYIHSTIENGWSRSLLEMQIVNRTRLRVGGAQNNFARTLPTAESDLAGDIIAFYCFRDKLSFLG